MVQYRNIIMQDYDEKYKISKERQILCYSKKKLEKKYPDGNAYTIIGEAKKKNKKEQIAELIFDDDEPLIVSELNKNSKLLYRKAGYVCVGNDAYIALLKSRFLFFILLFGSLCGIGIAGYLLWNMLISPVPTIAPEYPLPEDDPYDQPLEDDESEKVESEAGGGSVTMAYTLEAGLSLSDKTASVYFMNPNASNHSVSLDLYIVSGEQEVMIAQSGLVSPGYGLTQMDLIEDAVNLSEGVYEGYYKVHYYNSETGEMALVESTITDLTVTVTN